MPVRQNDFVRKFSADFDLCAGLLESIPGLTIRLREVISRVASCSRETCDIETDEWREILTGARGDVWFPSHIR